MENLLLQAQDKGWSPEELEILLLLLGLEEEAHAVERRRSHVPRWRFWAGGLAWVLLLGGLGLWLAG